MARVAIVGAAGRIGGETIEALSARDVTAIDVEGVDDDRVESHRIDITDEPDRLRSVVDGHDVLVHLAAHADPYEEWENVLELNIGGTHTAFDAARDGGVDRVVFASSNHVTHLHNIDEAGSPETMRADAGAIHPDDPMGPDSYYGVSKVTGEALADYYAETHGLEFVNLRIGWYLSAERLRELQAEPDSVARYARAMFLSPRDCRDILRRAAEADLPENPLTVNVTSRNANRYLSLTEAIRSLGYEPRDDAAKVLAE